MQSYTAKLHFLKSIFGEIHVARDGINVSVRCPNCDQGNKKKFSINLDNWNCHCWVCDIKGKDLRIILKKFISNDSSQYFVTNFLDEKRIAPLEMLCEEKISLPKTFTLIADSIASRDPDIKACIRYLKKRGLSGSALWRFRFGTADAGFHRRRIIIPSFDDTGNLNYYCSRSIDLNVKPKYSNPRVNKLDIIFNEIHVDWKMELTLTEGPFDLTKCEFNATCLLGSSLSEDSYLFKKIVSNKTPILLALDSDMTKKSQKCARLLSSYGCNVRILELGKFADVGEMSSSDFVLAKKDAYTWTRSSSIKNMIRSIQTGSII
jgi:hypothetical protein